MDDTANTFTIQSPEINLNPLELQMLLIFASFKFQPGMPQLNINFTTTEITVVSQQ